MPLDLMCREVVVNMDVAVRNFILLQVLEEFLAEVPSGSEAVMKDAGAVPLREVPCDSECMDDV